MHITTQKKNSQHKGNNNNNSTSIKKGKFQTQSEQKTHSTKRKHKYVQQGDSRLCLSFFLIFSEQFKVHGKFLLIFSTHFFITFLLYFFVVVFCFFQIFTIWINMHKKKTAKIILLTEFSSGIFFWHFSVGIWECENCFLHLLLGKNVITVTCEWAINCTF